MTDTLLSPRRLLSSAAVYASAGLAQQAVGFLLIPIYTRLIDPAEYGILEILNPCSSMLFAALTIGLASAINKCHHRDCRSSQEQASVLPTALLIDLPILLGGSALLLLWATPVSRWLVGHDGGERLLRLVVVSSVFFSLDALVLASLRAQERAAAFAVLSLTQLVTSLALNVTLVVAWGWGIEGILWGNVISNAAALPVALIAATRAGALRIDRRLIGPLLRFGGLIVPVMLAGWVMNVSDRYVLRLYRDLDEVAVYGVGYKFGMIVELAIVWPFQLAWPAFSFAISKRSGYRTTYAQALTYLTVVLVAGGVALALLTRVVLPEIVGAGYRDAYRVVPLIALAYAFNGVQYCVSPGLHLAGRTHYLALIAVAAAVINLGLSFVLIPYFGMTGAAAATAMAFAFLAGATLAAAQRAHPVPYEYGRLVKVIAAGGLVYVVALTTAPTSRLLALLWDAALVGGVFPALLLASGFLDARERGQLGGWFRRIVPVSAPR